jgi:hypothetical protein
MMCINHNYDGARVRERSNFRPCPCGVSGPILGIAGLRLRIRGAPERRAMMKEYVRCKACGYIMEASKLKDVCPACGVPAKVFEPYKETISEERKRILDLHIHPIVVHLPQGFAPTLVVLALALAIFGEGSIRAILLDATRVLAALLPLSVVLAFAAGVIDGNLRFHKVTTPLLVRKMVVGALFFAAALAGAVLALFTGLDASTIAPFAVLELLSLVAAVLLGNWGFGLLFSRFPGK